MDAYPEFKAQAKALAASQEAVTNTDFLPAAVGEVPYLDPAAVERRMHRLPRPRWRPWKGATPRPS